MAMWTACRMRACATIKAAWGSFYTVQFQDRCWTHQKHWCWLKKIGKLLSMHLNAQWRPCFVYYEKVMCWFLFFYSHNISPYSYPRNSCWMLNSSHWNNWMYICANVYDCIIPGQQPLEAAIVCYMLDFYFESVGFCGWWVGGGVGALGGLLHAGGGQRGQRLNARKLQFATLVYFSDQSYGLICVKKIVMSASIQYHCKEFQQRTVSCQT